MYFESSEIFNVLNRNNYGESCLHTSGMPLSISGIRSVMSLGRIFRF